MQENTAFIGPDLVAGPAESSLWQEAGSAGYSEPHPSGTTCPVLPTAPWASTQAGPGGVNESVTL